jgi:DNA-directed RNA polymerase specialized sigma24 family protein
MLSNLAYACEELGRLSQALRERAGDMARELTEVREALSETAEGAQRLEHLLKDLRKLSGQTRVLSTWQQLPAGSPAPALPVVPGPERKAGGFRRARQPDTRGRSVWQGRSRRGAPGPRWAGAPPVNGEDVLPGNDRATLEAFRRGEAAVLTQVYRAYSPEVVRYLSRRFLVRTEGSTRPVSLTPLDLESAHQETFVRAFRPSMRLAYDGVRPYLGFLLTIANSTAIDLMRASGRVARESISMDEAPSLQQLPGEAPDPEEQAMEAEVRGLVRRFLAGLPE